MCCFSRAVRYVARTRIFARGAPDGRQYLAYSMQLAADEDLAMILPLPVATGSPDDALQFIDLSGYADLFGALESAFPAEYQAVSRGGFSPQARRQAPLAVHDVGSFEASFVPTTADFDRLDPRFRLPTETWERLDGYRDHGFAVFKLRRSTPPGLVARLLGRKAPPRTVHPMAFSFPRRDASALFFPTVHVHDGEVHPTARFDHTLYCQPDRSIEPHLGAWTRAPKPAGAYADQARARGLIDAAMPLLRLTLEGELPNRDTIIGSA
jgi:hypothetical protein